MRIHRDADFASRGDEDHLGMPAARVREHIGAARYTSRRSIPGPVQCWEWLSREHEHGRLVTKLHDVAVRFDDFVSIAWPENDQSGDGAKGRQVLHGLVSGSVFSVTHRIVSKHEKRRQLHQGRKPDRRPGVVAEYKEGRAVRPELRDGKSIQDGAHGVLPDAEVEVLPGGIIRLKMTGAFVRQESFVRWPEIGRSAQKPRNILREDVQYLAGGLAPGNTLLVRGKDWQIAIPSGREFAPLHLLDFGSELRILGPVSLEELSPSPACISAARSDSVLEVL